jgi:hypothetical protein
MLPFDCSLITRLCSLERIVALETEVKQIPLLRAQVNKYKDSVLLLEGQVTDLKVDHSFSSLATSSPFLNDRLICLIWYR